MSCDEANTFIEAVAIGDAVPASIRAHVAECPRCAARLTLAERIETTLAQRAVPVAPPSFTMSVMARLRRERWRTERVVDIGFNIAVAIGALLIVLGIAGVLWRAGALQIGTEMTSVMVAFARQAIARAVADQRIVTIGMLLLSTAVALWWWAEGDAAV